MESKDEQTPTYILALRGKTIDELRGLLRKHDDATIDVSALDQEAIRSRLSNLAIKNDSLRNDLKKSSISVKPSFYLLVMQPKSPKFPSTTKVKPRLLSATNKINSQIIRGATKPTYRNFRLESLSHRKKSLIEIELTWHRVYWYWAAPSLSRRYVYEMQFGFVFMDYDSKKAIVSCHSIYERDCIIKILKDSYSVTLSPLVLTRPVLEQIGTFEQLKRGSYFRTKKDPNFPSNITYADEDLAVKTEARKLEESFEVQRKQSFYQIPIGSIVEQGIGATSDSGKLWIPREISVTTIRDYSFSLLSKVAGTLDEMSAKGETDKVLETLGIPRLPRIASIRERSVKNEICNLFAQLVNMIVSRQTERPYLLSEVLPIKAVPRFFTYPRLQLTDPDTEEKAFWSNVSKTSQFVELIKERDTLIVQGYPNGEGLNLERLHHPITMEEVSVSNILQSLELLPTSSLNETIFEAIRHVSGHIHELAKVVCLPFHISAGVLRLDVNRALGKSGLSTIGHQIEPAEVQSFRAIKKHTLNRKTEIELSNILLKLGEKCQHMSDDNCRICTNEKRFLCLRSLVGHFLINPQILAHKGIELSDIQGKVSLEGEVYNIYGFSKMNPGKGGLTLRNKNGAILFAQVAAQLDKSDFTIATIITPSIINEDLIERLRTYCGIFGKKLLVLDKPVLLKMLIDYREHLSFEKKDIEEIYKESWKKRKDKNTSKNRRKS